MTTDFRTTEAKPDMRKLRAQLHVLTLVRALTADPAELAADLRAAQERVRTAVARRDEIRAAAAAAATSPIPSHLATELQRLNEATTAERDVARSMTPHQTAARSRADAIAASDAEAERRYVADRQRDADRMTNHLKGRTR